MWSFPRKKYLVLEDQEAKPLQNDVDGTDSTTLSPYSSSRFDFQDDRLPARYWKYIIWLSIINAICLLASGSLFMYWYKHRVTGMNAVLKQSSFFSPVLDKVEIKTSVKMMNASLFPGDNPGFARQFPNPEADAFWENIELLKTFPITKEDVVKLGKDPKTVAKFDDEYWGLGDDAYMAELDVFHQLHCLNQIRRLIYPEHYNYYASTRAHPDLWFVHLNHCVDIIAQNLMCSASTDIVTLQWVEKQFYPFQDFNVNHQCRDFDRLLDWAMENSVDEDMWMNQKRPEKLHVVSASKEMKEWIEKQTENANSTSSADVSWHEHDHR